MKMNLSKLAWIAGALFAAPAHSQTIDFADQPAPPPPDYAMPAAWAAGPSGPGAAAQLPAGTTAAAARPAADVFYIHPTTFRSPDKWNQDVADATTNAWTDASVIARQASIFSACCRIFAPRYRQAGILTAHGQRTLALNLATADVLRAFDHYIRYENHGRPFILAGHSQGAYILAALLERRIDGRALQHRMIAAYVVGINLAEGDFGRRYTQLTPCSTPRQTGCVVQWNSVLQASDVAAAARLYEKGFVAQYGDVPGKTTLCVNPLTFDGKRASASAQAARGAVPGEPDAKPMQPLVARAVSARCDRGLLLVDPLPSLGLKPLPGGVMHYHDFGLFYADVRANALARTEAFFDRDRKRGRR